MVTEIERARFRELLYKRELTKAEWVEYKALDTKINGTNWEPIQRVVAGTVPVEQAAPSEIPVRRYPKRVDGKVVIVEEVDLAAISRASLAQMTGQPRQKRHHIH